jgi:hypothetical protein
MIEFITQNWGELTIGIMALVKVIVNLTPTKKDNEIFAKLDHFINYFIGDKVR